MKYIIKTNNLDKKYKNFYSVKGANLNIREKRIYGLIGPNGAGKSTTMKMLLGLIKPSGGSIEIMGMEMNEKNRSKILSNIGSLIENPAYYEHLTGMENMKIMRNLMNVSEENIPDILKTVNIYDSRNKKVKDYSLGMKQRLGIAMALISYPSILILDEPINGLDPAGIIEIRNLIKTLPEKYGMTVIISSHILSEIEHICDDIAVIEDGNIIFEDEISVLKEKGREQIGIDVSNLALAKKILNDRKIASKIENNRLMLEKLSDDKIAEINRIFVENGLKVYRIELIKKSLEEIFLDLTGKKVRI